jgi:hypothetical protein
MMRNSQGILAAALLALAPTALHAQLVEQDTRTGLQLEAASAMLSRAVATRARRDNAPVLAKLLQDVGTQSEGRFNAQFSAVEPDTLEGGLRAAVGNAIQRHEFYETAEIHARAMSDAAAAQRFHDLAAQAAGDTEALGDALRARLTHNP